MEMTKENTYQNWKDYTAEEMTDLGLTFKAINDHFKNLSKNKEAHFVKARKELAEQLFEMAENYEIYYNWNWTAEIKDIINKDYWTEQLEITEEELSEYIKHAYNVLVYALGEEFNKRVFLENYLAENDEAHIEALEYYDTRGELIEYGAETLDEVLYGLTPEDIFWIGRRSNNLAGEYYYRNDDREIYCDDSPYIFHDENEMEDEAEEVLDALDEFKFADNYKEEFFGAVGLYKEDKYHWMDEVFEDLLF